MDSRDRQIVDKILAEIDYLLNNIKEVGREQFINDETLKRASAMTLINIGEILRLASAEFCENNTDLPINEILAMRNVAAHGYQTLRFDDVWDTIVNDIPALRSQLEKL